MSRLRDKQQSLLRRKSRVRRKVSGTPERPRLSVFRSLRHIHVQVIDDSTGRTLAAATTLDKTISESLKSKSDIAAAQAIGKAIAERAKAAGVSAVVFDRSGRPFHGRVKALADAAREGGLEF
ncbi:MAG: 50S ribosomal protein L18 [Armatimonadia bacterium]